MKLKRYLLTALTLFSIFGAEHDARAQSTVTQQQLNDVANNMFAMGASIKGTKLANQNSALNLTKNAFTMLEKDDNDGALVAAQKAILAYKGYSPPYLLCAYIWLKKDNPLLAHRFVLLYKHFRDKKLNKDLKSEIPADFERQVITDIENSYAKLDAPTIKNSIKKEGWLNDMILLDMNFGLQATDYDYDPAFMNSDNMVPDLTFSLRTTASYTHNFWYHQKDGFSNVIAKQYGLALTGGITNMRYFSYGDIFKGSLTTGFLGAGLYLGRFYAGVDGKLFQSWGKKYPNAFNAGPYSEYSVANRYNTIEARYYINFVGGRGTNWFKRKPVTLGGKPAVSHAGYLYVKYYNQTIARNIAGDYEAIAYNHKMVEAGLMVFSNNRVNFGLGLTTGYLDLNVYRDYNTTTNANANYFVGSISEFIGMYFRVGVRLL